MASPPPPPPPFHNDTSSATLPAGIQTVVVFSHDFLVGACCCIDQSQSDLVILSSNKRRIALGQASWCQAFWLPVQQRKHLDFQLAIDGTILTISRTKQENNDDENTTTSSSSIDWNKLLQTTVLKKIHVQDLGDLSASELYATIPMQDDAKGRGRADLEAMEKQLAVKVVWLLDDDDGHILLVGTRAKLDKKCLVIRNMLSHYYWRLKGKQVNL